MEIIALEDTINCPLITENFAGLVDADSTPTCAVYEDANDTPILTPTVTKRTALTGVYRVPVDCTAANGFEAGKSYTVIALAIIGGITFKTVLANFQCRTGSVDAVNVAKINGVTQGTPGASGALTINGTNAGNRTFSGTTTFTGHVLYSDGLRIAAPSTVDRPGLSITGNGVGQGVSVTGGTSGDGMAISGQGTGYGLNVASGDTGGIGFYCIGFDTGAAFVCGGINGDGFSLTGTGTGYDLHLNTALSFLAAGDFTIGGDTLFTGSFTAGGTSQSGAWGGLDAAGVRAAIGLASANLDTQLGDIATDVDAILAATVGTGPKAVTIHTTDGTVALGGVTVTVLDNTDTTQASGTTNGSGNLVVNLLASTTYTINTFKSGYTSAPSSQTTSAGNGPQTLATIALTENPSPTPPADPTLQTVFGTLILLTGPAENAVIKFSLVPADSARPLTVNGNVVTFAVAEATTDNTGFFTIDLPRTTLLDDPAFYHITCDAAQIDLDGISLGATPLDISTL